MKLLSLGLICPLDCAACCRLIHPNDGTMAIRIVGRHVLPATECFIISIDMDLVGLIALAIEAGLPEALRDRLQRGPGKKRRPTAVRFLHLHS